MTGESIDDPDDCRDRVEQRVRESPLSDMGYFHRVRAGSKRSAVSHSDPDNLSMSVPSSGNYAICASPDDTLILIDIDDHKDGYDADALQYAQDQLPDTLTFSSAHDGEGRLYHVPKDDDGTYPSERLNEAFGAANVSGCSWGEIRTDNQYVVGAGSQLDGEGCTKDDCDRCATPDGGQYTITSDLPIATLEIDTLIDILSEDRDVDRVDQGENQPTIEDSAPVESESESDDPDDDVVPGQKPNDADDAAAGAPDVQTPYDAVDELDAVEVAADTIVHDWNSDDHDLPVPTGRDPDDAAEPAWSSDNHTSADDVEAFYPIWGPKSNGTANVVGENGWKDTGSRGKGGPIVMAAIGCDDISIFDSDRPDRKAIPQDVSGSTWVKAYQHLKDDLGYDLPDLTPGSLRDVDDADADQAATALEMTLRLYEDDDDRSMDHWQQIWTAVGMLSEDRADDFADRVSDVCNVPRRTVINHAGYVSHENENGPIVVDGGKTWYLAGQPRRRYELLNFELDVESTLDVERGPIRAQLRADLPSGESFRKSVEPKIFNKKERFDDEILSESFGTKFEIPSVNGDQPYTQDLLDALRLWVHNQDAPHRTGVRHMGIHDDELVVPDQTLAADGWTDTPEHVYLDREIGAERRVCLPDDADADLDAVSDIVESLPQTRDPERLLPVLGWFYAAPMRPIIESFSESGEFNHLSVTGDTGSGKTATLGYLWRCFGMSGEPFSVDSSSFAQLATFSATNSIPLWFDEYKPSDIRDYKVDRFHDLYRKATRGAFAERGNADKTTTSYKIQAPVVVSGEQAIQGPAERRRSIMTQFRTETTDAGTETAQQFKSLIGQARMDGDDVQIGSDAPDPADHALAYYQFVCDSDQEHLRELWYNALERAHRRLDRMGVVDALDDLEIQGIQTVIFGYDIMKEFAGSIGADPDAIPDRDALDDAIAYVIDRIGPDGSRKSHADQFVELFARAAAAGDYIERGTHYELTKEGQPAEEIRINLPRTFDAISKYARDHDIESADLLNDHGDYRDRFRELAQKGGTYAMRTQQYTPGVSNCTGLKTAAVAEALEFDRDVLDSDVVHESLDRDGTESSDDDGDGDGGPDYSSTPDADPKPIGDIDADAIVATTIGEVKMGKYDGFSPSGDGPHFSAHIEDETGSAEVVIWDEDDVPAIFDGSGIGPDALLVRNAEPKPGYDDEDDLQLIVQPTTDIKPAQSGAAATAGADPGSNQSLADGGHTAAQTDADAPDVEADVDTDASDSQPSGDADDDAGDDTDLLRSDLDDRIVQEVTKRQQGDGADRDAVVDAAADGLDIDRDRVRDRIDALLTDDRLIYPTTSNCVKPK